MFTLWTQLRLRSHQNSYKIFTHKEFLPTSAGNAQAQLHFRDDQQRAFGISNISNSNYTKNENKRWDFLFCPSSQNKTNSYFIL